MEKKYYEDFTFFDNHDKHFQNFSGTEHLSYHECGFA